MRWYRNRRISLTYIISTVMTLMVLAIIVWIASKIINNPYSVGYDIGEFVGELLAGFQEAFN